MTRDSSLGKITSDYSKWSVLGRKLMEDVLFVKNKGGLGSRKEGIQHKSDRKESSEL